MIDPWTVSAVVLSFVAGAGLGAGVLRARADRREEEWVAACGRYASAARFVAAQTIDPSAAEALRLLADGMDDTGGSEDVRS